MDSFLSDYNQNLFKTADDYPERVTENIMNYLVNQKTAKSYLALSYFTLYRVRSNDETLAYIEQALNIDPDYQLALVRWILMMNMHSQYAKNMDPELYKERYDKIKRKDSKIVGHNQFYHHSLSLAYKARGNDVLNLQHYIQYIEINEMKMPLIELFGPHISLELAEKVYGESKSPTYSLIYRLLTENKKLNAENQELRARPGGPDYEVAKADFSQLSDAT